MDEFIPCVVYNVADFLAGTVPIPDSASTACDAIIALGSNIGDKAANLNAAVSALTRGGDVKLVS